VGGGVGWETEPAMENGVGQGAELSVNQSRKSNKGWEWKWVNKPTSQSRAVDCWASNPPPEDGTQNWIAHLAGEGAEQSEMQLWGKAAATWWKQQQI
jgi:hypothetical protein